MTEEARTGMSLAVPKIDGVSATSTSFEFTGESTRESWEGALEFASGVEAFGRSTASTAAWWIGDILCYGDREWGDGTYQRAQELTGRSYTNLRQLASVSKRVPPENRNPNLSWGHHREVAPHGDEQVEWLQRAEDGGWTRDELDREMGRAYQQPPADAEVDVDALLADVKPDFGPPEDRVTSQVLDPESSSAAPTGWAVLEIGGLTRSVAVGDEFDVNGVIVTLVDVQLDV